VVLYSSLAKVGFTRDPLVVVVVHIVHLRDKVFAKHPRDPVEDYKVNSLGSLKLIDKRLKAKLVDDSIVVNSNGKLLREETEGF
jgi:hypothetical protein